MVLYFADMWACGSLRSIDPWGFISSRQCLLMKVGFMIKCDWLAVFKGTIRQCGSIMIVHQHRQFMIVKCHLNKRKL